MAARLETCAASPLADGVGEKFPDLRIAFLQFLGVAGRLRGPPFLDLISQSDADLAGGRDEHLLPLLVGLRSLCAGVLLGLEHQVERRLHAPGFGRADGDEVHLFHYETGVQVSDRVFDILLHP
jgi:hypothetical protein